MLSTVTALGTATPILDTPVGLGLLCQTTGTYAA
jgi:hypothetical protein